MENICLNLIYFGPLHISHITMVDTIFIILVFFGRTHTLRRKAEVIYITILAMERLNVSMSISLGIYSAVVKTC